MGVSRFMARQWQRPRGLFGRLVMGPLLERANGPGNRLVLELMALRDGDRVLEVGFGAATLLLRAARAVGAGTVDGVEISAPMLARARRSARRAGNVSLHTGSVDALPFEAARFTCVASVNTVYFWPDLEAGLAELRRVCAPGARLVLGFGSDTAMRQAGYEARGFALYSADALSDAVATAGFTVERVANVEQPRGAFFALEARRDG